MKISKRELVMVIVLLIVAIVGGGYYLLLKPQGETLDHLRADQEELDTQVQTVEAQLASIPRVRAELEELTAQISEATADYLPEIRAEKIILMLDDLFVKNGMVVKTTSFAAPEQPQLALPQAVPGGGDGNHLTLAQIRQQLQTLEADGEQPQPEPPAEPADPGALQSGLASVGVLAATIEFEAPYDSMTGFIHGLEELQRSLAVRSLMVSQTEFGTVAGSIAVDFYAVPKIVDPVDDPYLEWAYSGEYGKPDPFAAPGYDLTFNIGSYLSGPSNLAVSAPTLSAEALLAVAEAATATVELEIADAANGFACAIRIGEAIYPASGRVTIASEGPTIRVLLTASARGGDNDLAGIELHVHSTATRPVLVTVVGDDTLRPRVAVGTLEGNVSVR